MANHLMPCISAHIFTGRGALLVVFCHLACWPSTTRRATDARSYTAESAMLQSEALPLPFAPLPFVPEPGVRLRVRPLPYLDAGPCSWLAQCESLWKWMQGRIYSWLAKRNNCGCYCESSICATCKTTACICNHPVTAQLKYEFGLAS